MTSRRLVFGGTWFVAILALSVLPAACSGASTEGKATGASGSSSSGHTSMGTETRGSRASSGRSTSVTSGGSSPSMTESASAADSGAPCNSLMPAGPDATVACNTGTPPTGLGGTLEDGTYTLTAASAYIPAGCVGPLPQLKATILLSGNGTSLELAIESGGVTVTETLALTVSGDMLSGTPVCGAPAPGKDPLPGTATYTATATSITLIDPIEGVLHVLSFTKT